MRGVTFVLIALLLAPVYGWEDQNNQFQMPDAGFLQRLHYESQKQIDPPQYAAPLKIQVEGGAPKSIVKSLLSG